MVDPRKKTEAYAFYERTVKPLLDEMARLVAADEASSNLEEEDEMSRYYELESLNSPTLYLDSPISLEVSGNPGNWIALWEETDSMDIRVEGEGKTVEEALDDCRKSLLDRYEFLKKKIVSNFNLSPDEERTWLGMCHYIATVDKGKLRPGEEFTEYTQGKGDDYKGPIYG